MFQYAAARSLAQRTGAELVLDTWSGFVRDTVYRRNYELDALPIQARVALPWERLPIWIYRAHRRYLKSEADPVQDFWYGRFLVETDTAFLKAVANADAIRNSKLEQAERAYLAFGTGEDFLAVIKRLNEESGPKLSNAVVNRRIKSTRVQLAKVKDQLLKALLPEEIERLTKWKKRLERKTMHEVLKRRGREVQQTAREAIQKRQFPKED